MAVTVEGDLPAGVTAKDVVLSIIARIGTGGGIGSIIEYRGSTIRALSMEGRMTVCNMSIEAGARAGMIAPDDTTFAYLEGRPSAPSGAAWERALDDWRLCAPTTAGVRQGGRDRRGRSAPQRQLGQPTPARRPPSTPPCPTRRRSPIPPTVRRRARPGLHGTWPRERRCATSPSTPWFIGSCTNARWRTSGRGPRYSGAVRVADGMRALVRAGIVRGEGRGEAEGLDDVFRAAGFEWREAGLLDVPGHETPTSSRRVSGRRTSNRNFEGRQGRGGRTHLVSPIVAAATAVRGRLAAPADL